MENDRTKAPSRRKWGDHVIEEADAADANKNHDPYNFIKIRMEAAAANNLSQEKPVKGGRRGR